VNEDIHLSYTQSTLPSSEGFSGVFKISVRRWRGAVGVEGNGIWWRELGPSPQKNHFYPQNDKFGCIFPQLLTGRKHGQLPEALGYGFYGSIAKRKKNSAKIIPKFTVRPGGGRTIAP